MADVPELTDGVVVLRARTEHDVADHLREVGDPVSLRWEPSPATAEQFLHRLANPHPERWNWVAHRVDDGSYVGSTGLATGVHGGDRVNLGWGVTAAARGSGLAVRIARLALDWALADDRFGTVVASVTQGNLPSRLTALRLGMTPEAVLVGGGTDARAAGPVTEHTYVRTGAAVALQPSLTAGDLLLRPWRTRDADDVVAFATDPVVVERTSMPSPYDRDRAVAWAGVEAAEGWARGDELRWAVEHAGRLVASVELRRLGPADGAGVWDVGCLGVERGHGFAPRAVAAAVDWLVAERGAARVEWQARTENEASTRAAQKAGFVAEGVRRSALVRRDGSRADAWVGVRLA